MIKNCKTYQEVVQSLCNDLAKTDAASGNNTFKVLSDNKTYVMVVNVKNGRTASSRCNKTDEFDFNVGLAIAWARYKRRRFFVQEVVQLRDLNVGDTGCIVSKDRAGMEPKSTTIVVDSFTPDKSYAFVRSTHIQTGMQSVYRKLQASREISVKRCIGDV